MRLLPYGDTALLVELDDPGEPLACFAALTDPPMPGVVDVVPAGRTVLVRFDPRATTAAEVGAAIRARRWVAGDRPPVRQVEIPVRYAGPDLAETAAALAWSEERLVAEHTSRSWRVGFVGFLPGFAYLTGEPEWPVVTRRADPRTTVPAGSVALADRYTGIYPRSSPGGWQLVGTTDAVLWDLHADPPALLTPGTEVRFVETR